MMKSVLGMGNALTDILAVLPDDGLLHKYGLRPGSMQHVDRDAGERICSELVALGARFVSGGSAANTICYTSMLGMPSAFIGKTGDDATGRAFRDDLLHRGVSATLLQGSLPSGRSMVFVSGADAERTFAVYLGAASELCAGDIEPGFFKGRDFFHIEGYMVQDRELFRKAAALAHGAGCTVSLDLASFNVVESENVFLHEMVDKYIDIVFANESEAAAFTGCDSAGRAADLLSEHCATAVVKEGPKGSWVRSSTGKFHIPARSIDAVDATGAGDSYAAGFLFAHSLGLAPDICGEAGTLLAAAVVGTLGTKPDDAVWSETVQELSMLTGRI